MNNQDQNEIIALYGSLMRDLGAADELGVSDKIRFLGPCRIPGTLYDLGDYPGLVPGDQSVTGELYEIIEASVLSVIDAFEDYFPAEPAASLYLRKRLRLLEPEVEAWVYVYNRPITGMKQIAPGDWREYVEK